MARSDCTGDTESRVKIAQSGERWTAVETQVVQRHRACLDCLRMMVVCRSKVHEFWNIEHQAGRDTEAQVKAGCGGLCSYKRRSGLIFHLVGWVRDEYVALARYRARTVTRCCMFPPGNRQRMKMYHADTPAFTHQKSSFTLQPPRQNFSGLS